MTAISDRTPALTVEYDCHSKRSTKQFDDPNKARRFYAQKLKHGRNPMLKGVQAEHGPDACDKPQQTTTAKAEPTNMTRPYAAGLVVKKHGITNGVTAEMIAEVDAIYGKSNPRESKFTLRFAVDAIRAFSAS